MLLTIMIDHPSQSVPADMTESHSLLILFGPWLCIGWSCCLTSMTNPHCCLTSPPTQITSCPPRTQAATLDMIQAYRNSLVIPAHKKYLVVCWHNSIYVQHNTIKGLSSASGIQGMPANALTSYMQTKFIPSSSRLTTL